MLSRASQYTASHQLWLPLILAEHDSARPVLAPPCCCHCSQNQTVNSVGVCWAYYSPRSRGMPAEPAQDSLQPRQHNQGQYKAGTRIHVVPCRLQATTMCAASLQEIELRAGPKSALLCMLMMLGSCNANEIILPQSTG